MQLPIKYNKVILNLQTININSIIHLIRCQLFSHFVKRKHEKLIYDVYGGSPRATLTYLLPFWIKIWCKGTPYTHSTGKVKGFVWPTTGFVVLHLGGMRKEHTWALQKDPDEQLRIVYAILLEVQGSDIETYTDCRPKVDIFGHYK